MVGLIRTNANLSLSLAELCNRFHINCSKLTKHGMYDLKVRRLIYVYSLHNNHELEAAARVYS